MDFKEYLREGGKLSDFKEEILKNKKWILSQKLMAKKPFTGYTASLKLLKWIEKTTFDLGFGSINTYDGVDYINIVLKTNF